MFNITEDDVGTDKLPITASQCLEMLREAVEDYGEDWVDPRSVMEDANCMNVYTDHDGNQIHCIAGYVFAHNFDFIDPVWFKANACIGSASNEVIWTLCEYLDDLDQDEVFTIQAREVLEAAQRLQDVGISWGVAVELVESHFEKLPSNSEVGTYRRNNDFLNAITEVVQAHKDRVKQSA